MNCPNCNTVLVVSDRQNVEIDYCPSCRGVWLDRGELDKIIERVAMSTHPSGGPATSGYERDRYDDDDDDDRRGRRKKRGGLLGELFDF